MNPSTPTFAIVSNTIRRSHELVERNLKASLSQGSEIEIILIDQNQSPLKLNSELTADARLRVVHAPVPSVSEARNLVQCSESVKWIIFCDDDGYLVSDYVERLKGLIQSDPTTEVFAGSIKRIDNQDFYSKRHQLGGDLNRFVFTKLLMGSNFVVTRAAFDRLKRFDRRFGAGARFGSGEETDFAWKAHFSKTRMRYVPELVVFHIPPHEGPWRDELRKSYRYGVGKGALVAKWLIEEHQPLVLMEMVEMLLLPVLRAMLDLVCLRFRDLLLKLGAVGGRVAGIVAFTIRN